MACRSTQPPYITLQVSSLFKEVAKQPHEMQTIPCKDNFDSTAIKPRHFPRIPLPLLPPCKCRIFANIRDLSKTLRFKVAERIAERNQAVFMREDFEDLGGYDQVGRALRQLAKKEKLLKIGYGLYAKTKKSIFDDTMVPVAWLGDLAREALGRLGIQTFPSSADIEYYRDRTTTQVPTGRLIGIKGRIKRRIGYDGAYIYYERMPNKASKKTPHYVKERNPIFAD